MSLFFDVCTLALRLQAAQVDSVNLLCSAKVQSHPESTVGLLTTAGKSARILISATQDLGKVFSCMHDVKLDGSTDIMASIQKAQLALKHRQNLAQRQRIVLFVSSPIKDDEDALVRLAKKLKKNNVAVDIVHVSDDTEGENVRKLDAFNAAVNASENSRILHVPAGGGVLADVLMGSEIYAERDSGGGGSGGDGAGAEGGGGGGGGAFEFGVDPAVDPELAMVLRMSMEEENARQAAAGGGPAGDGGETSTGGAAAAGNDTAATTSGAAVTTEDDDADLYGTGDGAADGMDVDSAAEAEEEAMLAAAIRMSQAGDGGDDDEEMDEETRRAIEMSKADFDETKKDDGDASK